MPYGGLGTIDFGVDLADDTQSLDGTYKQLCEHSGTSIGDDFALGMRCNGFKR